MSDRDTPLVVEGFLVGGDVDIVQLVMPPYLLGIARDDVLQFETLPALPLQDSSVCIAVRLELRHGARLLDMRCARALAARMWPSRRPFALATRPPQPPLEGEASYAERERRFFAALGLEG